MSKAAALWISSLPSSCGSSWQRTATDVARPDLHDRENAAPIANPSAKLWIPSPIVIMKGRIRCPGGEIRRSAARHHGDQLGFAGKTLTSGALLLQRPLAVVVADLKRRSSISRPTRTHLVSLFLYVLSAFLTSSDVDCVASLFFSC